MSILFKNAQIIDPTADNVTTGDLMVSDGVIVNTTGKADTVIDCTGKYLAPGIVDIGVKVCEPGERHKESYKTAGAAAAAGGDTDALVATGYLMRTTAVYGNGKFGIADRDKVAGYDGLEGAFQAEMLTVFLIREFTVLLAEYCAKQRGGERAVGLSDAHRRYLGVGNSTGLGPILKKVEDTIVGIIINIIKGFKIPPVRYKRALS